MLLCCCTAKPALPRPQVSKTLRATHAALLDNISDDDCNPAPDNLVSLSQESDAASSKLSMLKRRANQQETEGFYFTVSVTVFLRRTEHIKHISNFEQHTTYVYNIQYITVLWGGWGLGVLILPLIRQVNSKLFLSKEMMSHR